MNKRLRERCSRQIPLVHVKYVWEAAEQQGIINSPLSPRARHSSLVLISLRFFYKQRFYQTFPVLKLSSPNSPSKPLSSRCTVCCSYLHSDGTGDWVYQPLENSNGALLQLVTFVKCHPWFFFYHSKCLHSSCTKCAQVKNTTGQDKMSSNVHDKKHPLSLFPVGFLRL